MPFAHSLFARLARLAFFLWPGLLALVALPTAAVANDAVAGLDAGEIVLGRSDVVRMAAEDLYLSRDQIRVRYLFRNDSDQAVRTWVAFPLPPIHMQPDYEYGFTNAHRDAGDPVGFRLWINGQERPVALQARAVTEEGRDVTALLQKWQVPLVFLVPDAQAWDRLWGRLDGLPAKARAELGLAGAILEQPGEPGFTPNWIAQFSYYWSVTFPANATLEMRHTYSPVPEAFFFGRSELDEPALVDEACIDQSFRRAALARFGDVEFAATTGWMLRYILTTANSWRGPIGRFHLTVDKGSPDMLVSLCRDGIRKTGPTTFEWRAENWVPERNLSLLFLAPPG